MILLAALAPARAAQYTLDWWTVDGGGGTSTNASGLVLSGTMGQPDAGVMTGGTLRVVGGFWGGITPPPPPPPAISNLVVRGTRWPPQLHVEIGTNVDRVEYTINGRLALTTYGPPFDAEFDQVWFRSENPFVVGSNHLRATAVTASAGRHSTEGSVVTWPEGPPVRMIVLEPYLDFEVFTEGATAPSAPFMLKALAAVVDPTKSSSDPECESPVDQVDFYVNGERVGSSSGGTGWRNLIHEVEFDPRGLPRGCHSVRAKVLPPGGTWPTWASSRFWVTNRYPIVTISRTVTQHGNYFDVALEVHNRGTGPAFLKRLSESVTGFQMCCFASSIGGATLNVGFSYIAKESTVGLEFPPGSELAAGSTYTLTYKAVPILFRTDVDYGFGGGGGLEYSASGSLLRETPLPATSVVSADGQNRSVARAAAAALRSSDYLLVTSPNNLFALYTQPGAIQVMTNMAELAVARNGVLGYYHSVGRMQTAFQQEDLLAVGRTSTRWGNQDQVLVGRIADNVIRCYSEAKEQSDGGFPLTLTHNLAADDALAVGNISGDESGEILIAKGNGDGFWIYQYDPGTEQFTSSVFGPSTTYARGGDRFALGQVIQEASGAPRDEIILANRYGIHVWDYAAGSDDPALSFESAFQRGDLFAVGNLYNTWHDAIVVGSLAEDKLYVYVRKDDGSGYRVEQALSIPLDAGDALAIGDVSGGGGAGGQEIIVADASEHLIRVFGWTGPWRGIAPVFEFPVWFSDHDRLATGYLGSQGKERILVLHGHDNLAAGLLRGSLDIIALMGGEVPGDRVDLDGLLNDGGAWAGQLDPHWTTQGFLLLVGENGIIPAFSDAWTYRLGRNEHTITVDLTDREYASTVWPTDWPELSVGRLIGDSAERLSQTLRTAIEMAANPNFLRNVDAFCGSHRYTWGGDGEEELSSVAVDKLNSLGFNVRKYVYLTEDDLLQWASGQDVIFLIDVIGNPMWDKLGEIRGSAVEEQFDPGNTRPLIFTYSDQPGRYVRGRCLAEAFLAAGASSFIGTTVPRIVMGLLPRPGDREDDEINRFFDYTATCPLGTAMKLTKAKLYQDYGSQLTGTHARQARAKRTLYVLAANHYFGDPKLEIAFTDGALARRAAPEAAPQSASSLLVTGPVAQVQVTVPMYSVRTTNGFDWAEIPGSKEQLEAEGRPLVPQYRVVVEFPKGYKVQAITMPQRSEPVIGPGLNLAIVEPDEAPPTPGWWPDTDFDWWTTENLDGSSTLRILVYPFQAYQEGTNVTQVRFHTNYTFGIDYAWSDVEVRHLATDWTVYPTGAVVQAEVYLLNTSTQAIDVVLSAQIVPQFMDATNPLPARPMVSLKSLGRTQFEWYSTGQPPGPYRLEVVARDAQGTLLDDAATEFQIGQALGTISEFSLLPQDYQLGDNVNLSATFANTGSKSLEGSVIIAIQDAAGNPVTEFRRDFSDLMPGASYRFDTVWTNASLSPRNCRVLVYGQYSGQTTALLVGADWHDAPLRWDVVGAGEGQVQLRWLSVAGRTYTIEFTPVLGTPFTPLMTGLPATPPLNSETLTVTPDSKGFYRLREE